MTTGQAKTRCPSAHGGTMAHGSSPPHRRSLSLQHLPDPASPLFSSTESEEERSQRTPSTSQCTPVVSRTQAQCTPVVSQTQTQCTPVAWLDQSQCTPAVSYDPSICAPRTSARNSSNRIPMSARKGLRKSVSTTSIADSTDRRRVSIGGNNLKPSVSPSELECNSPSHRDYAHITPGITNSPCVSSVQSPQYRKHSSITRSLSSNSEVLSREQRRRYSVDYRSPRGTPQRRNFRSAPATPATYARPHEGQFHFERDISAQLSEHSSSSSGENELNWSEYSARKGIVRFRSRKSAQERRTPVPHSSPSKLVHKVFHNQYEIARSPDTRLVDKLMAIFYCWYFGWLTDVYNSLTSYGQDRSPVRWSISCMLVSIATVLVATLLVALLFITLQFVMSILEAGLWFLLTIVSIFILCLCAIAIVNFD